MPLDPALIEIMSHKFAAAAEEMVAVIHRTSRSTFVKEALDFGVGVCDVKGKMFAFPRAANTFAIDMPCTVTITPVDARDRTTVNQHWKQRVVMDKLMGIVECPHKLWGESWTAQNKKGEDWRDYIGERRPASEPCWHVPKGEDRENCFKRRPTE